tara:strand:- start:6589 stop:7449 length:861 start_codon:yes stop_codon:yes gene_type:complete
MVEEKAEQLKSTAQNIRKMFNNFNAQFKSLSDKRKKIQKDDKLNMRRTKRISSFSSPISKSANKIKQSIIKGPSDIISKVLNFASILLIGAALNNLPQIKAKVDSAVENVRLQFNKVGGFFTGLYDAVRDFISGGNKSKDVVQKGVNDLKKQNSLLLNEVEGVDKNVSNFEKLDTDNTSDEITNENILDNTGLGMALPKSVRDPMRENLSEVLPKKKVFSKDRFSGIVNSFPKQALMDENVLKNYKQVSDSISSSTLNNKAESISVFTSDDVRTEVLVYEKEILVD